MEALIMSLVSITIYRLWVRFYIADPIPLWSDFRVFNTGGG